MANTEPASNRKHETDLAAARKYVFALGKSGHKAKFAETAASRRRHRCPQIDPSASREAMVPLRSFGEVCHRMSRPRTTRTAPYYRLSLNAEAGRGANCHARFA